MRGSSSRLDVAGSRRLLISNLNSFWTRAGPATRHTKADGEFDVSYRIDQIKLRVQQVAGVATALLAAGLAPALVMAAFWHTAKVAPFAFTFTFAIALSHAVLLVLPLFLVFLPLGRINVVTCVVFGFAVIAAPVGVLTWPPLHP